MNHIYRVIWNRTLGRYVVGPEFMRSHAKAKGSAARAGLAAAFLLFGWAGSALPASAEVTVADASKYGHTVTKAGDTYTINNQQTKGDRALNRFDAFSVAQNEVANLQLGTVDKQINIVNQKMSVDGVVNAIKDNKIGGDVYFFSDKGIAIGKTGVINVGRLTLGTNSAAGTSLYKNGQVPSAEDVAGDAPITMAGTIYAQGDVVIGTKKDLTVNGSIYAGLGTANGAVDTTGSAETIRASLVNLKNVTSATKAAALGNGDVALYTEDVLTVAGADTEKATVKTLGGNLTLTSASHDAKLQAAPKAKPGDGYISITDAYLDTSAEDRNSGNVDITAVRDVMGTARIDVDDSTIHAAGTSGHEAGNVIAHATASTKLYTWDIGDGAYAQIYMGKKGKGRNAISGDNIDIAAKASTAGDAGNTGDLTDAEITAGVAAATGIEGVGETLKEMGADLRAVAQVTDVAAGAVVDIEKTDLSALGGTKGDTSAEQKNHGDLTVTANAVSAVTPTLMIGPAGYGVNVGLSSVDAHVDVDDSTLYAAKDIHLSAAGDNTVKMSYIELNLLDRFVRSTVNMSWAEVRNRVSTTVGKKAVLTSGKDTDVGAASTRMLYSNVSNGGDTNVLGLAASVAISDTSATAEMAGTVYAGGDVKVNAENTLAQSGGVYQADDSIAASMSGISLLKETVDPITGAAGSAAGKVKDTAVSIFNKIKSAVSKKAGPLEIEMQEMDMEAEPAQGQAENVAQKKPWNKLGLNGATAIVASKNTSEAAVTGKVRGISDTKTNEKYVGADTKGAKSLNVNAHTLSRSMAKAGASQSDPAEETGAGSKAVTVSAAVSYMSQKNDSKAYISGDVKTTGDVTVKAETEMPWKTKWASTDLTDQMINAIFTAISTEDEAASYLVDSWTQSSGGGKTANGAASISVVNYDNSASAYIGKKDDSQTTVPKVEADGNVDVNALTDITTVNFTGTLPNLLNKAPLNLWKNAFKSEEALDFLNTKGWSGADAAENGIGGAALAMRQKNTTKAYIDGGAQVKTGKDVSVKANTETHNFSFTAAGGQASSIAIDATVGVDIVDNTTKAYIGDASVEAGDAVSLSAVDKAVHVNASGVAGVSQGSEKFAAAVGAAVGYNHITRDTEASLGGGVSADGNVAANAQNTGEIISASVAGAVVYENETAKVKNLAGSNGFHAPDGGDVEEEGEDVWGLRDLFNDMAGEDADLNEAANQNIAAVAGQDNAMAENAGQAKNGLAIAANVAVNRINDTAKAFVAKAGSTAPSITADALSLISRNDSAIYTTSGTISANLSTTNTQSIAGSFMYNDITAANEAYADGATLTLGGNDKGDESLTISAGNDEQILNIAGSGSGTTKGNAVAGQISLNWMKDTTKAYLTNSTLRAAEAVTVEAADRSDPNTYTGAVAATIGGSGNAVGAAIGVNLLQGDTSAYVVDTEMTGLTAADKGGSLSVSAEDAKELMTIMASGGVADKFVASFTGSGNWISNQTDAYVKNSKTMNLGTLSIAAANHGNATLGIGNLSVGNNAAGASIGVMVNDSTVNASLTGDENKKNTISAEGIFVSAENVYNGKAQDSDSSSTAKTVAVGFAGGMSQFAGSGSVTVNVIKQTTDATMGKGKYNAGAGAVTVKADTCANLFGMAGGLSVSGGTGIGAAVDVQHYTGHTYAGMADGAYLSNASAVKVDAESRENMTSVAATLAGGGTFGGAGAAGAHSISTDTKAYMGNETDAEGSGAELTDAGQVSVTAKDTTKLGTGAGSGGVGGTAGVGLTAAVEVVDKNVSAYVGNHAKVGGTSLNVQAENISESTTASAGLGAGGTAGVAGAFSETFVNHATNAYVGKSADVTVTDGAEVKATSSFKQGSGAGSLGAGGTVGAGMGNATASLNAKTKAYVDDSAKVNGGTKVDIAADHTTDITYATVAGGLGGTVGVNGAVSVNDLKTETKAYVGNSAELSAASAEGGISISASDTTKLDGGNGGLSAGAAGGGAGAAIAVNLIDKDTQAYAGQNAKLTTKGETVISAKNTEDIYTLSVQAAGGIYAGLAGAANGTTLDVTTKAFTDTGVTIGSGDVSLSASHELERLNSSAIGASLGAGAIGAAVDVGLVKTQTNAYLGNGNTVTSTGSVSVAANDNMSGITTSPYAAAIGAVGLSGSISVYTFGSKLSAEDAESLKGNDGTSDTDFNSWVNTKLNYSETTKAFAAYDTDSLKEVRNNLDTNFAMTEPTTGEKGTLAKIGDGTTVTASGAVTVKADDTLSMDANMGNISGGLGAAGSTVSVVHTDTQTKALIDDNAEVKAGGALSVTAAAEHALTHSIAGASISGTISGQGTVATWNDTADVYAHTGDTKGITAGSVSVSAKNARMMDSTLTGASVALAAVNGAVVTARVHGNAEAGVGNESGTNDGEVKATSGDVTISASVDTDLAATATGAAAGIFAGTGTGVDLASDVAAKASVGKGEKLSGKHISITAENTPKLNAHANGAGVGLAGVGVTVAETTSKDSASVEMADDASLTAADALTLRASMKKPTDGYNVYSQSIAGSGGVLSGSVAVSGAEMKNETNVVVGQNAALAGKTVALTADHEDMGNVSMDSVSAGLYSGNGGDIRHTVESTAKVTAGDGTSISSTEGTVISAANNTEKAWTSGSGNNATSAGASAVGGTGIVSHTKITHTTAVDLGKVSVSANADDDANAIAIDAASTIKVEDRSALSTGSAVAAAHVENTTEATAKTSVTVAEGAKLTAGDVTAAKTAVTEKDRSADTAKTVSGTIRGGSIGIGTKNDANLYGSTLVDVFGAGGYAGSTNDITYTGTAATTMNGSAETAKGDIRTAAGRNSTGTAGTISVSGHSDILNATLIPISIAGDPVAKADSTAALTLGSGADLQSDRDVYLQSNAGQLLTTASGEVKDWVNAVAGAFGSEGYKLGKSEKKSSAEAAINGKVQTGIHRNRSVKFWGEPEKDSNGLLTGKWILYTDRDRTISYEITGTVPVGTDLFTRLDELDALQGDSAAMAAYDAERAFIENKLVEQGLGYYEKRGDKYYFVRTPSQTVSEYDVMKADLADGSAYMTAQNAAKQSYTEAKTLVDTQNTALSTVQSAYDDWSNASAEDKDAKKSAYESAATSYNETYGTSLSTDPAAAGDSLTTEAAALTSLGTKYSTAISQIDAEIATCNGQISATDAFFTAGGTESEQGIFTIGGTTVTKYTDSGTEYYLLHKNTYPQLTHDIKLGNIDATLGDIHLEADNVTGSGTLSAPGDAKVSITNETPYNLYVNDVTVAGAYGKEGAGTGGRILYNGSSVADVSAISNRNKDSGKTFTGTAETRNTTDAPSVTVESTFNPVDYKNTYTKDNLPEGVSLPQGTTSYTDPQPLFAAPTLHVAGTIYNPRGAVTVKSAKGDVYTEGSVNGGTISVTAESGDYIQRDGRANGIVNIGGSPLDDSGNYQDAEGSGILANGNIFISARYVNINSTIQSGKEDWNYEIPADYQLYYLDNGMKTFVTGEPTDTTRTYYVADKNRNALDENGHLTYDAGTGRFVLSGVDVAGGHVSIVGTILNTSKNSDSTGKIRALDGYGKISITNHTTKDLELRNLDTGEGVEGSISITDLDKTTGKVRQTTVYTRQADGIHWTRTDAAGTVTTGTPGGSRTTYATDTGMYYSYQTGRDWSETNRYELHKKGVVDWWGIEDKTPNKDDLLAMGGQLVSSDPGVEKALNGGAYISDTPYVGTGGSTTDNEYYKSTKTETTETKEDWDIQSSRKWYYLGLAKDWDVTLTETTSNTTVNQYSVKADHPVGIEFFGNQDGGTLTAAGGSGSLLITGTLTNHNGTATLSGKDITQDASGFIQTGTLYLNATGSAGTADQALSTSASLLGATAGDNIYVSGTGAIIAGELTAGKTLSLSAADGISQANGGFAEAQRIELDGGNGSITGAGTAADSAFHITAGQGSGKDYGLKASADGNISIVNTGGSLYLDSVTAGGDVTLTTDGSFVDNNFTDTDSVSAREKLAEWAKASVLEKENTTISKQKKLLTARVEEKYNEYQNLAAYVNEDGVYTLDETAKKALTDKSVDVDAYVAEKQKRYDELKSSVGSWSKDDVKAYIEGINSADDANMYGNADLTKEQLRSDIYLTQDEKANVLVGSAKSAQDLLITFTPGGIKEGVTDTRTTMKQTPHVTGNHVTLISKTGSVGSKDTAKTIDISDEHIADLTADDLTTLATAERSDFKLSEDKKTATVTAVRAIEADVAGTITASAEQGALYLNSNGAFDNGGSLTAKSDIRIKAAGDLKNLSVKSNQEIILEAGSGSISNVKVGGNGVLTARAQKGVDISKENGDLTINTLYASQGGVKVNLGSGSLYATGTGDDYINIEGQNISITGANNIGTADESVAMKVSGESGTVKADVSQSAYMALFGNVGEETALKAAALSLTNRGHIAVGTYEGMDTLNVNNAGTISGGTFTGGNLTVDNRAVLDGGTFSGTDVKVTNSGTLTGGSFTGSRLMGVYNNAGTLSGASFQTALGFSVNNAANASIADITATGSLVNIFNDGTMAGSQFTAETGDVTYEDKETASLTNSTLDALKGSISLKAKGNVKDVTLHAAKTVSAAAASDADFTVVEGDKVTLTANGTLTTGSVKAKADATLSGGTGLTLDTLTAGSAAKVTSTSGDVKAGTVEAGSAEFTAGGTLAAKTVDARTDASISGKSGVTVTSLTAVSSVLVKSETGNASLGTVAADSVDAAAGGTLTADSVASGHVSKLRGKNVDVKTITAGTDAELSADESLIADSITANRSAELTGGNVEVKTVKAEDVKMTASDTLKANSITADRMAKLTGKDVNVKTITAGANAELNAKESLKVGSVTANQLAKLTGGNLDIGTVKAQDAELDASDTLMADSVNAAQSATLTGKNVNVETITAGTDAELSAGEVLTVGSITANRMAKMTGGSLAANSVKAADVELRADNSLTADSITAAQSAKLTGRNLDVKTVTAGKDAQLSAVENLTAGTVQADNTLTLGAGGNLVVAESTVEQGTLNANAGGTLTAGALHAGTDAVIASGGHMAVSHLTTGSHAVIHAGGTMTAGTLQVAADADITAAETLTAESLTAGHDARLTSTNGDVDVLATSIGNTLSMNAGRDIRVSRSDSVRLTANAGGSILAETEGARISSGTISMKAGESIRVSDAPRVQTLAGVDFAETADSISQTGNAGSAFVAHKAGSRYDVSRKGGALLSTAAGRVDLTAKRVEVDTLFSGVDMNGTVRADFVGVDDIRAHGAVSLTVNGLTANQTAYAGLHTSAAPLRLADSYVKRLTLTGTDDLGVLRSSLGGNSRLASDYMTVLMRKRGAADFGEWIGSLLLNRYNITTDKTFAWVDGGITVNGTHPRTARDDVNGRLFGDRYLGRPAREQDAVYREDTYRGIGFAPVAEEEDYEIVMS